MEIHQSVQKLKDAGLYARNIGDKIIGGTHKVNSGRLSLVKGYFSLEQENNSILITIAKNSLEEATQFIIDTVKPGISDEPIPMSTGPQEY
jgi:hypothetical protein